MERIPPSATTPSCLRGPVCADNHASSHGIAPCSSSKKAIVLVRHGETALNSQHRLIGSTDVSLSRAGRLRLKTTATNLLTYPAERCLCSPMSRCTQTAGALFPKSHLPIEILPDLREINFGSWETLTFDEISKMPGNDYDGWAKFRLSFQFPGGERLGEFVSRMKRVAMTISSAPEETIVVITHGGVVRMLTCLFLGLPPRNYLLFDPKPASLTVINLFGASKGTLAALIPCGADGEK